MSKSPQKRRCDKCGRNLKIRSFSRDFDNCNSCIARQERQAAYLASVLEKLPFCHDENWKRYTHSYPHFLALLELRKYLASQGSIAAVAKVLKVNAGTIHKAIFKKYVSPKLYYRLGISEDLEIDDLIDENLHLNRNYEYYRDAARDLEITVQILEGENGDWKPAPVCPTCNEVHTVGYCTKLHGEPIKPKATYNRKRQPRPRLSIHSIYPENAALSITNAKGGDRLYIQRLISYLADYLESE